MTHHGGVKGTSTFVNDYTENTQGIPIPTGRVTRQGYTWGTESREEITVSKYESQEADSVPESEFMLSAFGFSEPTGVSAPTPWYLWTAAGGFVCLSLGALVYWQRRRTLALRESESLKA